MSIKNILMEYLNTLGKMYVIFKKNSDFIVKYSVHLYTKERSIYTFNAGNIQIVTHKITETSTLLGTLHTCYIKHIDFSISEILKTVSFDKAFIGKIFFSFFILLRRRDEMKSMHK